MFFFYQFIISFLLLVSPLIIFYRIFKQKEDIKRFKEKKLSFRILSNKKTFFNLRMSKKYLKYSEYISSDPIFLKKFIIWQPKLLRSFFLMSPKIYIVWGEVSRINSWILLIIKRYFFTKKIFI